jgi:predicted ribosomally synthesized peptide with SipW-like signal peptide
MKDTRQMKLRTIAVVGGLGVAGLALIGAGAAATFTQNTTSSQKITAGTMNVTLSAPGAQGNDTPSITLPDVGPVGSTFTTGPTVVTITNNGSLAVSEVAIQLSDTTNNGTLKTEAWVCVESGGGVFANEPLTTVEGYGAGVIGGSIAPGATDSYIVIVYAGSQDTGCGTTFTGFAGGSYTSTTPYPNASPNPDSASLTNAAQGGTLTPTFTVTYTA